MTKNEGKPEVRVGVSLGHTPDPLVLVYSRSMTFVFPPVRGWPLSRLREALVEADRLFSDVERRCHEAGQVPWWGEGWEKKQAAADFEAFWMCADDEPGACCLLCLARSGRRRIRVALLREK